MPLAHRLIENVPVSRDRHYFKVGAVCACASGAMAFTGNLLHGTADVTEHGLHHLAMNGDFGVYRADHFLLALALCFALCGYSAIADSLKREESSWARFGMLLAQMGATVVMVALGIDGFAMVGVAQAWAGAAGPDRQIAFHVAQALWGAFVGIFALGVFAFFGCAPFLFGLAFRGHHRFPRWLSPAALVGGTVGMALGVILAFVPISFPTYAVLFGTTSTLLAVWMATAGLHIWRAHPA